MSTRTSWHVPRLVAGALAVALASACSETPASPDVSRPSQQPAFATADPGIVAHVSIGSNDICEAVGLPHGCDANFSLVANQMADGSVSGQWEDEFGKDASGAQLGGVHIAINCLEVDDYVIGTYSWPIAWVSGVVTQSTSPYFSVGEGVVTVALDRGTSQVDAFADLASFTVPLSLVGATSCHDRPDLPAFPGHGYTGQVVIWTR